LGIQLITKERKYLKVSGPGRWGRRKIFKQDHPPGIEVMTDGKNIQMPLLPKHPNHLERVPKIGKRQDEAEEV
jgi:hypothetical protein